MANVKEPTLDEVVASLAAFCGKHDLGWDGQARERFVQYLELLEEFNAHMNLIGPLSRQAVVDQLLIDSVTAAVVAPPAGRILDVGSGAGLPGIPLKILYPDRPMTLVEPRKKRATFLTIAIGRLGLGDVEVAASRIETAGLDRHDYLISKAFRPPPAWVDVAADFVAPRGRVVCLHSASGTADARARASHHGLTEIAHVADVSTELDAPVPDGRAITVFEAP